MNWWIDETPPRPGDVESTPNALGDNIRKLGEMYGLTTAEVSRTFAAAAQSYGVSAYLTPKGEVTLADTGKAPIGTVVSIDPTTGTATIRFEE